MINSVVSLYYYAYVVRMMFLQKGENQSAIHISLYDRILMVVLIIPTLVLGVYWTPIINITSRSLGLLTGAK